jgi:hypothetical protein
MLPRLILNFHVREMADIYDEWSFLQHLVKLLRYAAALVDLDYLDLD